MTKKQFYFLRHGETQWNKTGRTQGQSNIQLNHTGVEQADDAAFALQDEPISAIVSSPLSRAHETAKAVAQYHDVPIELDDRLKEATFGDLEGEPHASWMAKYWTGEFSPPNGESFDEFCARIYPAMQEIIARQNNILIVAHGGLWIAAQKFIAMQPERRTTPNALPLHVTIENDVWHNKVIKGLKRD